MYTTKEDLLDDVQRCLSKENKDIVISDHEIANHPRLILTVRQNL